MVSKMSVPAQNVVVVPVSSVASCRSRGPVGLAITERLDPAIAVALDVDRQPLAEGIDDTQADAMQTTGDLVAAPAELAAGMQHGQHDGDGRQLLGGVLVDGDAATVVDHAHPTVFEQRDLDPIAVAGQSLVDGVVDDLPHEVVQAAFAGRPDVHARALANCLEALEDGDGRGVVDAALSADR